jgi:threonine/homoserine/homoserine lactone efflux protein
MNELLPSWSVLSAYMLASVALAMTPGPGVFYIVTRSLAHGRRSGIASVAGVALGNLGNAIAASVGLAALFAVSALAFEVVKYAGALYLVFLGVRTLRAPRMEVDLRRVPRKARHARIFRDGFVVALLNPKTAVFFAAFLPQFLNAKAQLILPSIVLGAIFVAIAAVTDSAYALAAGAMRRALVGAQGVRALGRYCSASALIGLGVFTAFGDLQHDR